MKKFFTYATLCESIKQRANRTLGYKTYHNFSASLQPVSAVVRGIPVWETIVQTTVYENIFPQRLIAPYDSVAGVELLYKHCQRCQLAHYREHVVSHSAPLIGAPEDATVVFMGQCPGNEENLSGFPFVGVSGDCLNLMFKKSGFHDRRISINTVGCVPKDGPKTVERTEPRMGECLACASRLWLLLKNIKPNIIVCLGSVAASLFWDKPKQQHRDILHPIVPGRLYIGYTYHPSYINRKMNKGGINDYRTTIKFLREVSDFSKVLKPYEEMENWNLLETEKYPIAFVNNFIGKL